MHKLVFVSECEPTLNSRLIDTTVSAIGDGPAKLYKLQIPEARTGLTLLSAKYNKQQRKKKNWNKNRLKST